MQLAILDRDGVINETLDDCIASPSDWKPIRGSLEAIARLHRAGWRVVVAMNEPAIASGQLDLDTLARINAIMLRRVVDAGGVIDAVFFCPHAPQAGCACHKPQPGMLLDNIRAARAAGASPLLVKTGKGFGTAGMPELDPAIPVYDDLYSAVDRLLGHAHA